ncbi:hypothetical protein phi1422_0051 [Bdellovibrio phage phi1422]|uniref:virion structural protein n=1 Tax=Bdellovibrio phage phi1422 TaxID=1127515 RepID=UPI0002536D67|nr:virion structural protein [Bdellovibrio phage phi1422]AFC22571.1 hypothetical protein phi1422_0051 [Bdellovibrio phage phi1422]
MENFMLPTVEEFKAYFTRDFPYNDDPEVGVTDTDIQKAMNEAEMMFNEGLFSSQQEINIMFFLLTAHYLVMDLRMAAQGINGSYSWITTSKSVGSVSESFQVPTMVADNPILAALSKTNYGGKYINLIMPYLVAPIMSIPGRTKP